MSRRRTVVLGSGPVGLIASYLLDADVCVGTRVGPSPLEIYAPSYLWRTEATERLLSDLSIPYEGKIVRFGVLDDDGVRTPTPEDRERYFERTRGDRRAVAYVPTCMTDGLPGELRTFDVSVGDLAEELSRRVEVRRAVVRAIGVEEADELGRRVPTVRIVLRDGVELSSRRVVSTLPAPVFDDLLVGTERIVAFRPPVREWRAIPKTFVRARLDRLPPEVSDPARDLAYLYVVAEDRERYPFDRVTFFPADAIASLEFNGSVERGRFERGDDGTYSGPFQILGPSRDPIEFGGAVWHLGRFARWRHSVRIHDAVEELYDVR